MRVLGLPRAFYHIARHPPPDLSPKAQERLRWLACGPALRQRGLSSQEAAQVLGLPRSTLYRWQKRLQGQGPKGWRRRAAGPKAGGGPTGRLRWWWRSCASTKLTPPGARRS
jgi:hypothetical protein